MMPPTWAAAASASTRAIPVVRRTRLYCWHLLCTVPRVPAMSLRTDKQRMLRQRIAQIQAEEKVAQQQLASYRAYQQRELEEVRPCVV